jgi:hypothetical protein
MSNTFDIASSDPVRLAKATSIATDFARQYVIDGVVGIALLGAVARGYFDAAADIDVAVFKRRGARVTFAGQFQHVDGFELHCHLSEYEDEAAAAWSMAKRWTYSQARLFHDPEGRLGALLAEKVPLKPEERKWLLMSGLSLSEWCVNRLSQLWVERGNFASAHQMFATGLDHFFDLLFAWNNQLVADNKWKYYCAEKLDRLPTAFREGMQATMLLQGFSLEELDRRRGAFMGMWQEMLPLVEAEVGMSYAEIVNSV